MKAARKLPRGTKDWISAQILGKVAERKQRKATLKNSKTRVAKTEAHHLYTENNKEVPVKRSVKCDKKDFVETPDEPPDIPETPLRINTDRPSKQEIRKAILQLKNEKATGPDGIPPEAIKAYKETSVDCLYQLFGKIWVEEEIPEG